MQGIKEQDDLNYHKAILFTLKATGTSAIIYLADKTTYLVFKILGFDWVAASLVRGIIGTLWYLVSAAALIGLSVVGWMSFSVREEIDRNAKKTMVK